MIHSFLDSMKRREQEEGNQPATRSFWVTQKASRQSTLDGQPPGRALGESLRVCVRASINKARLAGQMARPGLPRARRLQA